MLVSSTGVIKLGDMGISRTLPEATLTDRPGITYLGTARYMDVRALICFCSDWFISFSSQPAWNKPNVRISYPVDIFSLGLTLLELALGSTRCL